MRQPYLVVGTLLIGLFLGAGAVMAQEDPGRLPGSALGSQGALSDKDRETVTVYITYWVKELQSDDPERVAVARGRLLEAYNQGGTESFVREYDATLAGKLGDGLQSKHMFGRMNTVIVAQRVRNDKVVDVIKGGLKDEQAAVVYQAAVAAEAIARNANVAEAAKFGLVRPISDALKKEKWAYVLEYLYRAAAAINDPNGLDAAMNKMNERIADHVASAENGIEAEFEGMKALQAKIISAKIPSSGISVPDKTIHLLLLTSVRYMDYCLQQPEKTATITGMLALCDQGAQWVGNNAMAGKFKVPKPMKDGTDNEKKLFLTDWQNILKADPLKFTEKEINVPMAKAP